MKRLKYGMGKTMSLEEKRLHIRAVQRDWRHRHPDFVKKQNKYFSELYKKTKPCICICKICGAKFNKPRKHYKICPTCIAERLYMVEMRKKVVVLKRKERKAEYEQIVRMHKQGVKQQVIADTLGRSQSGVSQIIRRLKRLKKQ